MGPAMPAEADSRAPAYYRRLGRALVISNFSSAQAQMRDLGFEVSTLATSALRFSAGHSAFDELLKGQFSAVWADTPGSALGRDPAHVKVYWANMSRWALV